MQAIKEESEEEYEEDDHTWVTPEVGELLVIRRVLHAKQVPLEPSQINGANLSHSVHYWR